MFHSDCVRRDATHLFARTPACRYQAEVIVALAVFTHVFVVQAVVNVTGTPSSPRCVQRLSIPGNGVAG